MPDRKLGRFGLLNVFLGPADITYRNQGKNNAQDEYDNIDDQSFTEKRRYLRVIIEIRIKADKNLKHHERKDQATKGSEIFASNRRSH